MGEGWVQGAIKRPGSLRRWLERHRGEIRKRLGADPFTEDGRIRLSVLRRLRQDKELLRELAGPHWRRIYRKIVLAITLRKLARRRRR